MAVPAHLSKHIERLHHISLYLELKLNELLGQLLFCLPTELQHLPVWSPPKSQAIKRNRNVDKDNEDREEFNSQINNFVSVQVCWWKCKSKGPLTVVTHPRRESSPSTAAPSTKHCARIVSGSFFWKQRDIIYYRALCYDESSHVTAYQCECMRDGWMLSTHRRRLDGSLLDISPLLTLQAGSQLLVSAVCHLFDQVQTLLHLKEHAHTHIRNVLA